MKLLETIVLFLLPVIGYSQKFNSYELKGNLKGLPDNTKLYLIRASPTGSPDTVQVAISKNGEFIFNGALDVEGELYFVKLDTTNIKLTGKEYSWIRLVLDNSRINITGMLTDWPNVEVKGSAPSMIFEEYMMRISEFENEIGRKKQEKDSLGVNMITNDLVSFTNSFIHTNITSVAAPLIMTLSNILSDSAKHSIYKIFPENVKNSFYGREWIRDYNLARSRSGIRQGATIPNFEFKNKKGESISILTAIKNSKYTLIDFWASWCVPCRAETPNLKKAYQQFNDRGFNIIGIAVKDEASRWYKALEEENVLWMQGRDDDMEVWDLFGFSSIPAYAIVDSEGKLIAYQCALSRVSSFGGPIRGENLIKKLNELILKE